MCVGGGGGGVKEDDRFHLYQACLSVSVLVFRPLTA